MATLLVFMSTAGLVLSACSDADPGGASGSYGYRPYKPAVPPAKATPAPVPDRGDFEVTPAAPSVPIDAGLPEAGDAGADVAPPPASDGFDAFQHHNLDAINAYRVAAGRAPLTLDAKLSAFAVEGSQELSQNHSPHKHFTRASRDGTLFTSGGFTGSAAENQGDPHGWTRLSQDPTVNEMSQIDAIVDFMFDEGRGGGHHDNMLSATYHRLGVGLIEVQGALYLTNDFSQ